MPPTPLASTNRFIPQGTSKYYWITTVANTAAPTRLEIDAGTDLTGEVAAVAGFSTTAAQVDVPDAGTRFVSRVPGVITADDSAITFYGSKNTDDAESFFTRDQTGHVMFADGGDVTGQPATIFPVTVSNVSRTRVISDSSQVVVSFSITSEPDTFDIPA